MHAFATHFFQERTPLSSLHSVCRLNVSKAHLALVLQALSDAISGSYVTKEELDQYGVVFRMSTSDSTALAGGSNKASTQASVLSLAQSSTGAGLSSLGAQSLLDSTGGIVSAGLVNSVSGSSSRRRRQLLQAGSSTNSTNATLLADQAAQTAAVTGIVGSLTSAGASSLVDGQDPFTVASNNLQIGAKVMTDPAGSFGTPAAPGTTSSPSFSLPEGLLADAAASSAPPPPPPPPPANLTGLNGTLNGTWLINGTRALANGTIGNLTSGNSTAGGRKLLEWNRRLLEWEEGLQPYSRKLLQTSSSSASSTPTTLAASTAQNNPFSYSNDSTRIAGSVATFGLAQGGNSVPISNLSNPITFTIPAFVSGSSCRKTAGGCKYFDKSTQTWSSNGVIQISATDTVITCQTIHLTDFGASANDVVPAFNAVNPIDTGALFSHLSLDNATALFVVGIIMGFFALLNFVGYAKDVRDRAQKRIEDKISAIDARLSPAKQGGLDLLKGVARPERAATARMKLAAEYAAQQEKEAKMTVLEKFVAKIKEQHRIAAIVMVSPEDPFTRPQRLVVSQPCPPSRAFFIEV